jgi:hypothetical protein
MTAGGVDYVSEATRNRMEEVSPCAQIKKIMMVSGGWVSSSYCVVVVVDFTLLAADVGGLLLLAHVSMTGSNR